MAKKGKMKISKIKRTNHTTNKMKKAGKLKLQRHKPKSQPKQKQPTQMQPEYSSDSESSSNEWADMLDEDEQQYIMTRLAKQPTLLSNIPDQEPANQPSKKRKRGRDKAPKSSGDSGAESGSDVEGKYEQETAKRPTKKLRPLLPIKTKEGIMERAEEVDESDDEQKPEDDQEIEMEDILSNDEEETASDSGLDPGEEDTRETVTAVELLAARRDRLQHEKLRIGALCSSLLECPEKKIKNLYPILYLMEEKLKDGTLNLLSVRKLATISAAEVFRDILPDYKFKHQDYSDVKLKKDTLALYKYEKELLEFYKRYLVRVEKATGVLRRKKGDHRKPDPAVVNLGILSLRSMCSLLEAKPNFNYSTNIAQSVVPFLDCKEEEARKIVTECCSNVFKDDSKGDITLVIVRLINQLVKRRGERLHPSALDCLLELKIDDVQLDAELEIKAKKKQEEKHKKRIVNLSKKEKKRAKKLKEVERELLETEAKESETARMRQLTEVTKLAFHIYFRLLKTAPRSLLLNAVLTGLTKFTHVINMEYYSDLVAILSSLLRDESLSARSRLRCACAALGVLAATGDALAVDPRAFHTYLYGAALHVHAASDETDSRLVLECVAAVAGRARRVAGAVLAAFAKRLATLAAQLTPHAALAALLMLRQMCQQNKAVSALLDTDEAAGSGRYDPQSAAPEHCGAHAAVLFELAALARHHHPAVRRVAAALRARAPLPAELSKLTPLRAYDEYDGSKMAFKPSIPPPTPATPKNNTQREHTWLSQDLKTHCLNVEESVDLSIDSFTG